MTSQCFTKKRRFFRYVGIGGRWVTSNRRNTGRGLCLVRKYGDRREVVEEGNIIFITGTKPPCNLGRGTMSAKGYQGAMLEFAKKLCVNILFFMEGRNKTNIKDIICLTGLKMKGTIYFKINNRQRDYAKCMEIIEHMEKGEEWHDLLDSSIKVLLIEGQNINSANSIEKIKNLSKEFKNQCHLV